MAAAQAAVGVPAADAEAAAWTVRGWADVAVGTASRWTARRIGTSPVPSPGALDEVIRSVPVVLRRPAGGQAPFAA